MATSLASRDIAERVSFISGASLTKDVDGSFLKAKTPTADDLEDGALREGGQPSLLSKDYIGVLAQYAAVGLIDAVLPATVYPVLQNYLNTNGATAVTASTLVTLPWSFKFFYGVLSDTLPVRGYRRRPYMVLGWTICIAMLLIMAATPMEKAFWADPADAKIDPKEDPVAYELALSRANNAAPTSGGKYVVFMMLSAFGYLLSDVCADGVVVELAQREPLAVRGTTQSAIYGTRYAFNIIGRLLTGFAFNGEQYGGDFGFSLSFPTLMLIIAIVLSPVVPVTWFYIREDKYVGIPFTQYMSRLWTCVQTRAVYQVMFYQFFANMLISITYTASSPFQSQVIKVMPINDTISNVLGSFATMVGIAITGKYGLHWNWRTIIVITGAMVILIDCTTTLLAVFNAERSQWFWLGPPIAANIPNGINFVIGAYVIVELAGEGQEGAMYGLMTTVGNLGTPFAASLTKIIDRNWDFSNERIKKDSNAVRWDITYTVLIMYASTALSWLFLFVLPHQKEATQELKRTGGSSKILGAITVVYLSFALVWSVTTNLMGIFNSTSCLIIAGGDGC